MSELVFATVLIEIKNAFRDAVADPDLIELLYDAVALPSGLKNNNGSVVTVSKGTASKIINREKGGNPLRIIRSASQNSSVKSTIVGYFKKSVISRFLPGMEDEVIFHLRGVIKSDKLISDSKKSELMLLGQKNTFAEFLANVYLYSLTRDNILSPDAISASSQELEEYKKHPLEPLEIPDDVIMEERKYAMALAAIYGELAHIENFDLSLLSQYADYQKHFCEQRGYYFAAEAVRRGIRDIYSKKDPDQFEILKDETYEGVKEIWEDDYKDGMTRLRKVMTQASLTRVDRCWLSRDTDWIGNPQKKGICHFLVKEDKLKGWVKKDAEQAI
ncbi:MAG TPA: hypothetical protein PK074_09065 [Spirochaetales bacterium]|nr:hypothetical protein [Spirochaetales bacterium]HQK34862.1 hypothetical protein [Spirochaetales bacterium]